MHINQLEEILEDEGIVFLTYGGLLSQALIVGMTDALELEAKTNELGIKVSTNLLTIFIELSQNMMNYSRSADKNVENFGCKGLIIVGFNKEKNEYYIYSRNVIHDQDKERITPKIEQVIPLNKEELKKLYRELRKSGKGKHQKGAGIGFVEVARRCDKIEYSFTQLDDDYHYFIVKSILKNI